VSDTRTVYNVSALPVSVPGGLLEPGVPAERPDSEQLAELVGNGTLREGDPSVEDVPYEQRSAEAVREEFDRRELDEARLVGSGKGGGIVKSDLVRALERDDQEREAARRALTI
jgi:pyruvate/2-oxoglutarate dehydrogenase complex dihydrolipoamide acyltransferase (E2) component